MACAHLLYRYQTRRLILGIITIREITKTCRFTDLYVKIHDGCTQKLLLPPQPLALQSCPLCPPQSVVILPFFVSTWCRLIFGENISPFSYTFVCFLNVCTKYLLQNLTKLLICLKNKKGFNISNDLKAPFFQSVGEHFLTIGLARTHAHTQTVKSVSAWFAFPRLFSVFHPKATSVASMSGGTAQLSSARTRRMTRWHTAACSSSGAGRRTRGAWAGSCRCWRWAGDPGQSLRCGCRRPGKAPVYESRASIRNW